jgi:hypothetical protein
VLSGKGSQRGWTRPSGPAVTIEQPPRQITLRWLDGTEFGMEIGGVGTSFDRGDAGRDRSPD